MSFTALLLPLLPHLTHYQYLAEKKICPPASAPYLPSTPGSSVGTRRKQRARRRPRGQGGQGPRPSAPLPARLHSALHTGAQLFLDLLTSPDPGCAPCPLSSPASSPSEAAGQSPARAAHTPTWAGPDPAGRSALRSAASSAQMRPACSPPPLRPGWEARPGAAPQGLPSHLRAVRAAPARSAEARPRGAPSRAGAPGPPGRARRRRVACGRRPPPPSSRRSAPGPSRGAAPRRCRSGPTPGSGARSAPRPPRAAGQELGKEVRTLLLPPAGLPPGSGVGRRSRPLLGGRP